MAKDVLSNFTTKATLSVLDKLERKTIGQGVIAASGVEAARAGKGLTLLVSNEDMDDIIKIVESQEKSHLLTDDATETVKHEMIKQEGEFCRDFDSTYGFFYDTTCGFFIDKFYNSKMTRRRISSVISITFNDESSEKRSQKTRKRISYG